MVELIVVDNSVLMPLVFADEDDTNSRTLMVAGISTVRLLSPTLCITEFGNGILNGLKRNPRRISEETAFGALAELTNLPLQFKESTTASSLVRIGRRALRLGLSFYDAVYLDLALCENASIATFDLQLKNAALTEGVPLWPWNAAA